ncbi:nucleoside monophosphate kinase [Dactylosporangium sp. NPDC049742]|uniref:nucleoside monophosphate kinase n=1 Tax=Dactylosporangium sp. NPDC049742 TaxID=3154737 RepID=UPI0034374F08
MPGPGVIVDACALGEGLGLRVVNAGDLFRDHVQRATPEGLRMAGYVHAGAAVPTDLLTDVVCAALPESGDDWLLYGHPRTVDQADALARRGCEPQAFIELVMTADDVNRPDFWLAEYRRENTLRVLPAYEAQMEPVRSHFRARGTYRGAAGFGGHEDVASRLLAVLAGPG